MLETNTVIHNEALESKWQAREKYWRRKLGRLRLGVEPIEDQLARYNRVTWAITAISTFLGLTFLTLFTVFGRADIGLIFDAIILLPIVGGAWIDHALLANQPGATSPRPTSIAVQMISRHDRALLKTPQPRTSPELVPRLRLSV